MIGALEYLAIGVCLQILFSLTERYFARKDAQSRHFRHGQFQTAGRVLRHPQSRKPERGRPIPRGRLMSHTTLLDLSRWHWAMAAVMHMPFPP